MPKSPSFTHYSKLIKFCLMADKYVSCESLNAAHFLHIESNNGTYKRCSHSLSTSKFKTVEVVGKFFWCRMY